MVLSSATDNYWSMALYKCILSFIFYQCSGSNKKLKADLDF